MLRRAVELGVTLIDTADSYGPNVSEELIAEALYPYPEGLVIATKGGMVRPGPDRWVDDGRPEHLREACHGSLERLRLERIDLYQLHAPDRKVPLEESVGALKELQDEGRIRHIGLSTSASPSSSAPRPWRRSCRCRTCITQTTAVGGRARSVRAARDPVPAVVSPRAGRATSPVDALVELLNRSPVMLPIPGTSSVAHSRRTCAQRNAPTYPADRRTGRTRFRSV